MPEIPMTFETLSMFRKLYNIKKLYQQTYVTEDYNVGCAQPDHNKQKITVKTTGLHDP